MNVQNFETVGQPQILPAMCPSDELGELASFGLDFFAGDSECETLFQVLRCIISISQSLGKTASAVFYEIICGNNGHI
ncbi:hypothetical protein QYF36_012677 [Acer negundo]|nr:hypothetical protein QYF36_012677 [Acer negundo]